MQKRNTTNGKFDRLLKDIICPICKVTFHPRLNTTQFCSKICSNKALIGKKQSAQTIKKRIIARKDYRPSNKTKEKMRKARYKNPIITRYWLGKKRLDMTGKQHWNWKGGIGRHERNNLSSLAKYKNWRKNVFKRDNWTCVNCNNKKDIIAHHIKNWFNFPKLRYRVSNGLTLCKDCHKGIHYFFGKYTE